MNCECEACHGTGEVKCYECNGNGTRDNDIQNVKLEPSMHNYKELVELQKDARRAMNQAARLNKLNPSRIDSYQQQLVATLSVINKQADKASKAK